MLRRIEEREPVSPLEVDKELAADGRLITPMQKRRLRLSIMLEVNGYVR